MRILNRLTQAALLSACVAAPLALVVSGDYGRAAAPAAPGYAQLERLVRGDVQPVSMVRVDPAPAARRQ